MSKTIASKKRFDEILDEKALHLTLQDIANRLGGESDAARQAVLAEVKRVNEAGRQKARDMLNEDGGGVLCAQRISHLEDKIIAALFNFVTTHVYRKVKILL
jgi:[protein-PII] uridylyltransferase